MRRKLRRWFQARWAAWVDSWLRLEEKRSQKSSQVDGFWRDGCWVVSWILHFAWEMLLGGQLQKKKSRCRGKRQFVETESFCLKACFSKFLSYTNKCPGQLPDGLPGAPGGDLGSMEPITPCPDQLLGWGTTFASQPDSGPVSGLDTRDLGRQWADRGFMFSSHIISQWIND